MRNGVKFTWIFLVLAFQVAGLYGKETEPEPECFPSEKHLLEIGGNYSYLRLTPTGLSAFRGNLGGVQFSYEYRPTNSFYNAVTFLWREGSTNGIHSLTRGLFDADSQLRIGYTFKVQTRGVVIPFSGFGWRYIGQRLKKKCSMMGTI